MVIELAALAPFRFRFPFPFPSLTNPVTNPPTNRRELFNPAYLFDEGSTVSWVPCGRKLTCSFPGIKMYYGPDSYYGEDVSILEMDGQFDKIEELIYLESHLSNTSSKFYGELTSQMMKNTSFPGSNNGTGLFQTIVGLKVREVYEKITESEVAAV